LLFTKLNMDWPFRLCRQQDGRSNLFPFSI